MKPSIKSKAFRIIFGIALPLACVFGALFLYFAKQGPPCAFYTLTGLYCPGCGSGRASVAIVHGNFAEAFGYNPIYVIFLPFLAYYLLKVYINYVFGKDILPFFKLKLWMAIIVLAVVVLFWIFRNIPVYPFTYLAP